MKPGSLLPALLVLLLSFLYLASTVTPARADIEFNVNSTADAIDAIPGDGACATAGGDCTLRAAIQEANALPGDDSILLPSGTYSLTILGGDEDAAATGDLDITGDLTLTGAGADNTVVSGSRHVSSTPAPDRVFHVPSADTNVYLEGITIQKGSGTVSQVGGGGILNAGHLTVVNSTLRDNGAYQGGGIYNAGEIEVVNSTVSENSAAYGGGLYNSGTATFVNSTVSVNIVRPAMSGDWYEGALGGGIYNDEGTVSLANVTLYANRTGASHEGYYGDSAAIWNQSESGLGTITLKNTLVAGNVSSDGDSEWASDCAARYISEGYNLFGSNCAPTGENTGNLYNATPELDSLGENGGPTLTHALQDNSPALDAGDPAGCTDFSGNLLEADQRSFPRPADGDGDSEARCDIGAVEDEGYVPPPPGPPSIFYQNVEPVGDVGGQSYAVAVQGRYAYTGMGWRIAIVDLLDPANPTIVGTSDFFPRGVQGITVAGDYAYVAAGGLYIVDVSDPTDPTTVGGYTVPGRAMDVTLDGQYAYVAAGSTGGLRIIDVSNPAAPAEVGYYHTPSVALSVAVSGTHAYVADAAMGVYILDVTDPSNPFRVTLLNDYEGNVNDVLVSGDYLYVAEGWYWDFGSHENEGGGLHILDVSDPTAPWEASFYDTESEGHEGGASSLAMAGSNVYVTDDFGGLYVIEVSNPVAPAETGALKEIGLANDVALQGDYAYIAGEAVLSIVDVSSPSDPARVGFLELPRLGFGAIAVNEDKAYLAPGTGLEIWDLTDPTLPQRMAVYNTPGKVNEVVVSDTYAYMVEGPESGDAWLTGRGLHIVDVHDSTSPTLASFYDTPGAALDLSLLGERAYVADGPEGLHIFDISDPTEPALLGTHSDHVRKVAVAGNYAYILQLGTWDGEQSVGRGLRIVDVSDPTQPQAVGLYEMGDFVDVAVAGNYAYVTEPRFWDGEQWLGGKLRIVDVSDPTQPEAVGVYQTPGEALEVTVRGAYAYVADGHGGMRVIDVSDPSTPFEVGFLQTTDRTTHVVVDENYIYTTQVSFAGLIIQRFNPTVPTALRIDSFGASPSSPSYLGLAALLLAPIGGLFLLRRRQPHS